jgi:hypothetical protein
MPALFHDRRISRAIALTIFVIASGSASFPTCFADPVDGTSMLESFPDVYVASAESDGAVSEPVLFYADPAISQVACRQCQGESYNAEWANNVRAGYEDGFVIASRRNLNLETSDFPFRMVINGWGQLRHTVLDSEAPTENINQFQLKRGRLTFSGHAFTREFVYLLQLDGRSSSGDDVRLLDYNLSYDLGHHAWGMDPGVFGFRTGKWKVPFTVSRYLSGREFEFADRSMASIFFDVNRSFAWGLFGAPADPIIPWDWEVAIFNGLVTGGAETGSSGALDDNFAYSARVLAYPTGDWGTGELADFDWHDDLATRIGFGYANSTVNRLGTTEFNSARVVDSGKQLGPLLPAAVLEYNVNLFAISSSTKFRGGSSTVEYYFRTIAGFKGADVPRLFDHGFWLQLGKFIIPDKLQLLARWSRVVGNSGTLGGLNQSSDEISGGLAYYFREQNAKFVIDLTNLNGAPINSAALDISPGEAGWLARSQTQFAF